MDNLLLVFLDESGNLDFGTKGTKHFVLTAIESYLPVQSAERLQELKYQLLGDNLNVEYFHASEDLQVIRDRVFAAISRLKADLEIHYVYAVKQELDTGDKNSAALYSKLGAGIVNELNLKKIEDCARIILVFDKTLNNRDEKAFLGRIKPLLKKFDKPYQIYFHKTAADFNAQIADYCSWAKYVSLERNENRPLGMLKDFDVTTTQVKS
jgi:hypothetical protein